MKDLAHFDGNSSCSVKNQFFFLIVSKRTSFLSKLSLDQTSFFSYNSSKVGILYGKYVDIRGGMIRLIDCFNPDISQVESIREHRSSVIAPHCNAKFRAAGDELAISARGGSFNKLRLCFKMSDVIKLDHSIETKGGACFGLAPAVATALHYGGEEEGILYDNVCTCNRSRLLEGIDLSPHLRHVRHNSSYERFKLTTSPCCSSM